MKKSLSVLFTLLILCICSCTSQDGVQKVDSPTSLEADTPSQEEQAAQEESLLPDVDDGMDEIMQIVEGTLSVVEYDSLLEVSVFDLGVANSRYVGSPSRYAVADLNDDGTNELVIEFSLMGDTAIINRYEGKWMAYYRPFRGIKGLKDNGVFDWSNSAFDSGSARLCFFDGVLVDFELQTRKGQDGKDEYYLGETKIPYEKYTELLQSGNPLQWQEF